MPKFGVSIYSISRKLLSGEISAADGVRWLGNHGAEVIELVNIGIDPISNPGVIDEVLSAATEVKVPIENYSITSNFLMLTDEEYQAEMERVKAHIDVAGKLGVPTMRIDCSILRRPYELTNMKCFMKDLPLAIETYTRLCDYAQKQDVKVLYENHGIYFNGSERAQAILDQMDSKVFGHQMDVGNFICVDDKPEIAVKKMVKYATTVHMKDFYIRPADRDPGGSLQTAIPMSWFRSVNGTFLRGSIMGQGDLDMYDILKTVKDSGFDGNIFIEYEGMEDCEYGTQVSIDNLKRIWSMV